MEKINIYNMISKMEIEAMGTSHNRTVYASPPVGGSASATARSIASLISTPLLRHSLSALVFAAQSPYSGHQTVVNSRNVRRHGGIFLKEK
jgi:hypothetical protein